ncbi:MAG: phosphate/phosphite/phosphonate ABC transporter substrate-binding protein [Gemmataceae bacterium]
MRPVVALRSLLAFLCGGALVLALGLPIHAEDTVKANPKIRVGVAGSMFRDAPAPLVSALMKPFKSLLDTQTGINGQMVAAGDAEDLGKQLADDKVQLGVFHGFEFAWAQLKHPELKALIITINPPSCCRVNVVIAKDDNCKVLADLKGKVVAIPMHTREHCHLFIERRCLDAGQPMQRFFEKVTTPADMEDALDGVVDGVYAAAVVDGGVLANYAKRKPGRANKLKTLIESEPFPPAVVACNPANLDEAVQKRFAEGLINAGETSKGQRLLTICRITGFETIPSGFEKELLRIAKAYPPPSASTEK